MIGSSFSYSKAKQHFQNVHLFLGLFPDKIRVIIRSWLRMAWRPTSNAPPHLRGGSSVDPHTVALPYVLRSKLCGDKESNLRCPMVSLVRQIYRHEIKRVLVGYPHCCWYVSRNTCCDIYKLTDGKWTRVTFHKCFKHLQTTNGSFCLCSPHVPPPFPAMMSYQRSQHDQHGGNDQGHPQLLGRNHHGTCRSPWHKKRWPQQRSTKYHGLEKTPGDLEPFTVSYRVSCNMWIITRSISTLVPMIIILMCVDISPLLGRLVNPVFRRSTPVWIKYPCGCWKTLLREIPKFVAEFYVSFTEIYFWWWPPMCVTINKYYNIYTYIYIGWISEFCWPTYIAHSQAWWNSL